MGFAALPAPAPRAAERVESGALRAAVETAPWALDFRSQAGSELLSETEGTGTGPTGTLGFSDGSGRWAHATRALSGAREAGGAYAARVATSDPLGGRSRCASAPPERASSR